MPARPASLAVGAAPVLAAVLAIVLTALLAAALAVAPVAAQPLVAGSACGGDAYSTAEVVEGRGRDRGPLVAVPDTLCADLAPQGPPLDITAVPLVMPQVGGPGVLDPYDGLPRRRP